MVYMKTHLIIMRRNIRHYGQWSLQPAEENASIPTRNPYLHRAPAKDAPLDRLCSLPLGKESS